MAAADVHAELRAHMKELVDEREPLDDLLRRHAEPIAQLRSKVADWRVDADDVIRLDDIALLRFILSHKGNADNAAEAVRTTLDWRKQKAELLACAKNGTFPPMHESVIKYAVANFLVTASGVPIFVIRAGKSDAGGLVKNVSHDDLLDWLMFQRERVFLVCDMVTRRTGKLTKAITIVDLLDQSMFRLSYTFAGVVQETSKISEVCYPQLLGKSVMMNMPSFVSVIWKIARNFLTKRTLEKTTACPGDPKKQDIERCPFFSRRFLKSDVPPYVGGSSEETQVEHGMTRAGENLDKLGDEFCLPYDMEAAAAAAPAAAADAEQASGAAAAAAAAAGDEAAATA